MKQDHAPLWTVALGCSLEHVHQSHQRNVETEDAIFAALEFIAKEVVSDELLLVVDVFLGPEGQHHVVDTLECISRHLRALGDYLQVVFETAFPREVAIQVVVLHARNA